MTARDTPALEAAVGALEAKRDNLAGRLEALLGKLDPGAPWECHPIRRGAILNLAEHVDEVDVELAHALEDLDRVRALGTGAASCSVTP